MERQTCELASKEDVPFMSLGYFLCYNLHMKPRVLVVIPAHNEAESIGGVLSDVRKHLKTADILVIDDCSTDDTAKIAKENAVGGGPRSTKVGSIKIIKNLYNLGYAYSIQTGIKYAKKHDYDFVVQMDADGQHPAAEAKKLLEKAEEKNADIVLGSRYFKTSEYDAPIFRRTGTKMFSFLIKLFTNKRITDPLSGFQVLNSRTIAAYAENYPEYPDAGLIIEMLMKNYKIVEVPVKMKKRTSGKSMHAGFIGPIKYMTTQLYSCVIIFIKFIGRTK